VVQEGIVSAVNLLNIQDWLIFRMNAKEETVKYFWDDTQRCYTPAPLKTKEVIPTWTWTKNTLASSLSDARWKIDSSTKVPEPIVIMLQCLRCILLLTMVKAYYKDVRFGFDRPQEPLVINSQGANVKDMWHTRIELDSKIADVRVNPEMTIQEIIQLYHPDSTDSTFRVKGSNTYLDQTAPLKNYVEIYQPKVCFCMQYLTMVANFRACQEARISAKRNY
jgi:hypothetical protein